jgi:hypothetical protein
LEEKYFTSAKWFNHMISAANSMFWDRSENVKYNDFWSASAKLFSVKSPKWESYTYGGLGIAWDCNSKGELSITSHTFYNAETAEKILFWIVLLETVAEMDCDSGCTEDTALSMFGTLVGNLSSANTKAEQQAAAKALLPCFIKVPDGTNGADGSRNTGFVSSSTITATAVATRFSFFGPIAKLSKGAAKRGEYQVQFSESRQANGQLTDLNGIAVVEVNLLQQLVEGSDEVDEALKCFRGAHNRLGAVVVFGKHADLGLLMKYQKRPGLVTDLVLDSREEGQASPAFVVSCPAELTVEELPGFAFLVIGLRKSLPRLSLCGGYPPFSPSGSKVWTFEAALPKNNFIWTNWRTDEEHKIGNIETLAVAALFHDFDRFFVPGSPEKLVLLDREGDGFVSGCQEWLHQEPPARKQKGKPHCQAVFLRLDVPQLELLPEERERVGSSPDPVNEDEGDSSDHTSSRDSNVSSSADGSSGDGGSANISSESEEAKSEASDEQHGQIRKREREEEERAAAEAEKAAAEKARQVKRQKRNKLVQIVGQSPNPNASPQNKDDDSNNKKAVVAVHDALAAIQTAEGQSIIGSLQSKQSSVSLKRSLSELESEKKETKEEEKRRKKKEKKEKKEKDKEEGKEAKPKKHKTSRK